MSAPLIQFQRLASNPDLPLPAYATAHAAAFDLRAAVPAEAPVTLAPGQHTVIGTGFNVALPDGYELQIRPRSGLAAKHGLSFVNTPGTIDADYRGEIGIILINHGTEPYTVQRGDRIAQCVLAPVVQASFAEVTELSATIRGTGRFGSTGRN